MGNLPWSIMQLSDYQGTSSDSCHANSALILKALILDPFEKS